jgi:hypothetical protein
MTSFLNFHAFAAARGDGLRPELRALFERGAAARRLESVRRLQAGLHSFLSMRRIEARRARRDQRFDQSPFVVGQIARISQLAAVVTGAALARPDQ